MKTCYACHEAKPETEFYPRKTAKDGLRSDCKACAILAAKADYRKNQPKKQADARLRTMAWRAIPGNTERQRAREKAWYAKPGIAEKMRLKTIQWAAANPERKKESDRLYRINNQQKIKSIQALWSKKNSVHKREVTRLWEKAHPESGRASGAKYRKAYPERHTARAGKRRSFKLQATPAWANEFFIQEIYHLAKLRSEMTGRPWHVDHQVPLKSKLVCGLHVEHNLAVIPGAANIAKSNRYWPDMP